MLLAAPERGPTINDRLVQQMLPTSHGCVAKWFGGRAWPSSETYIAAMPVDEGWGRSFLHTRRNPILLPVHLNGTAYHTCVHCGSYGVYLFTGLDNWTGLLDWTSGVI